MSRQVFAARCAAAVGVLLALQALAVPLATAQGQSQQVGIEPEDIAEELAAFEAEAEAAALRAEAEEEEEPEAQPKGPSATEKAKAKVKKAGKPVKQAEAKVKEPAAKTVEAHEPTKDAEEGGGGFQSKLKERLAEVKDRTAATMRRSKEWVTSKVLEIKEKAAKRRSPQRDEEL